MSPAIGDASPGAASAAPGPIPTLQWAGVTGLLQCGSFELNRLLREKIAPLPVRVDGSTFWYRDELDASRGSIDKALRYWRSRKRLASGCAIGRRPDEDYAVPVSQQR